MTEICNERTKADLLRAMSNEELANWFCANLGCPPESSGSFLCYCLDSEHETDCNACWMKWVNSVEK